MQDCYIFLTKKEIGKDSIYKVTQNKYKKRWLKWNTYFTSEAVARSVLIWQKKYLHENWSERLACHPWLIRISPRACARTGRRVLCFYCFFHNLVNFWIFSTFSEPKPIRAFYWKEWIQAKYCRTHRLAGEPVVTFRKLYLSKFQLLRQVRSLPVFVLCNVLEGVVHIIINFLLSF